MSRYLIDVTGRPPSFLREEYDAGAMDCESLLEAVIALQEDVAVLARELVEVMERLRIDKEDY
jgi:hypothetical protein